MEEASLQIMSEREYNTSWRLAENLLMFLQIPMNLDQWEVKILRTGIKFVVGRVLLACVWSVRYLENLTHKKLQFLLILELSTAYKRCNYGA